MLAQNLIFGTLLVGLTTIIHFFGLAGLMLMMRHNRFHRAARSSSVLFQSGALLLTVLAIFLMLTIEIWVYAIFYLAVDQFDTLEAALYFSTSTFTTVGFGDVYLGEDWRLLSAVESLNGFVLIGWSTAYLVSITARLRQLEADIEEERHLHEQRPLRDENRPMP